MQISYLIAIIIIMTFIRIFFRIMFSPEEENKKYIES